MKRPGTKHLVLHCTATPPDADVSAAEIDAWHRERGWSGIGYHFVVRRDGAVEPGRALDEVGAHVRGHNARSVGVCYVGGVDRGGVPEDNRTPEQRVVLRAIVAVLRAAYPDARVLGHRDFSEVSKACPSFNVATEL